MTRSGRVKNFELVTLKGDYLVNKREKKCYQDISLEEKIVW